MGERIELPQQLSGDEQNQLKQLWSYLYQMAENLNIHLDAIGGNELTDDERKIVQAITKPDGETPAYSYSEMETLKSLIIKTAEFVQTKVAEWRTTLLGETVAEGKFGRYVRQTGLDVAVNPEGITQNYSFQEIIQGLKVYEINAKNYIKSGLLRTVNSVPVYGVAIGKDIVTFSESGVETYNDGNKVAELTADELSFWQGGYKVASYKGNKISFLQGGSEVFYIQSGKVYCVLDLEIASGKKLIINTENFKIDSNGNVTIKGNGEFSGSLKAATGTFAGTMSAACITSGTMTADRIHGGELVLGGNNDANGSIQIKDENGTTIGYIGKWGFSIEGEFLINTIINNTQSYFDTQQGMIIFKNMTTNDNIIIRAAQISFVRDGHTYGFGTFGSENGIYFLNDYYSYQDGTSDSTKFNMQLYGNHIIINKGSSQTKDPEVLPYADGKCNLGNSSYKFAGVYANTVSYQSMNALSSRTVKHNIQPMESTGERLDRLEPVTFAYNNDAEEKTRAGLIWEDTVCVLPEICNEKDGVKSIDYVQLVPYMLKDLQDLRKRVAELERR